MTKLDIKAHNYHASSQLSQIAYCVTWVTVWVHTSEHVTHYYTYVATIYCISVYQISPYSQQSALLQPPSDWPWRVVVAD